MNYQDLMSAKECFEKLASFCDTVDDGGWWDKPDDCEITLREILEHDVANFIMYLSASDGHLSQEEVQAYRVITGFGGDDTDSIIKYIKEQHIYSMDFESEPPLIMRLLSRAERNAVMCGVELHKSVLNMVAVLYRLIGTIIISIDGGISYTEKRDFNIIMDTIDGYAKDHEITGNSWSLLGE